MTTDEIVMTKKAPTAGEQIAKQIFENYDINDAQDVQYVLKQVFDPLFESMLEREMRKHLGYADHEYSAIKAKIPTTDTHPRH